MVMAKWASRFLGAAAALALAACAGGGMSRTTAPQAWMAARDAAIRDGRLPRILANTLPASEPVTTRKAIMLTEAAASPRASTLVAGDVNVLPFSVSPITQYKGPFLITHASPGLVVGRIPGSGTELELRYGLPAESKRTTLSPLLATGNSAQTVSLDLRDEVGDSMLQRHVVLGSGPSPALLFLAEGSPTRFRKSFQDLGIDIVQMEGWGEPAVAVTRHGSRVVLQPGEIKTLGNLEIKLISSVAIEGLAREGENFQVSLILYPS